MLLLAEKCYITSGLVSGSESGSGNVCKPSYVKINLTYIISVYTLI